MLGTREYALVAPARWWSAVLVLSVTIALCLLHLPYPFYPDQAAFVSTARELADGIRYFGEFWDMKQPGIYWWYEITGSLFGFDALGVRLMDLCWSVFVTLMIWLVLRSRGSLVAILGPVFAFGSFYAAAETWHLSQVEWLVCGPLVVILWCVYPARSDENVRANLARYLLSGVMLGSVILLKTLLVPVAGVLILIAVGQERWIDRVPWSTLIKRRMVPAAAGVALVLVPVVICLALNGTLATAAWTTFVYPGIAVREYPPHSVYSLISSLRWFLHRVWMLTPWALWALYVGLRRQSRLIWLIAAWITVAFASITVQVLSYWQYHFDIFFVPVGILAAIGFADALSRLETNERRVLRGAAVAVLVLSAVAMMVVPLARKVRLVAATHSFPVDKGRALELALDDGVQDLIDAANAVRSLTVESDRIVVWGDPRMYFVMARRPVVEVDGGTIYSTSQLEDVAKVIRKKRPILFFMSNYRDPAITNHGGGIIPRVVEENYVRCYSNVAGTWYRLREGASATPTDTPLSTAVQPAPSL